MRFAIKVPTCLQPDECGVPSYGELPTWTGHSPSSLGVLALISAAMVCAGARSFRGPDPVHWLPDARFSGRPRLVSVPSRRPQAVPGAAGCSSCAPSIPTCPDRSGRIARRSWRTNSPVSEMHRDGESGCAPRPRYLTTGEKTMVDIDFSDFDMDLLGEPVPEPVPQEQMEAYGAP